MRELLAELRPKDYLFVVLILGVIGLIINIDSIISYGSFRPKLQGYTIETRAKILNITPKHRRMESQIGSNLKLIGYSANLEYKIKGSLYQIKTDILYSNYGKAKVDSLLLSNNTDSLDILIKSENFRRVVLNIN